MTLAASLEFTLFVGAARADATANQVHLMRTKVIPLLMAYKDSGDETPVREAIHRIMGRQWMPNAEYREAIAQLQSARRDRHDRQYREAPTPPPTSSPQPAPWD